jgi:hypothetical protein
MKNLLKNIPRSTLTAEEKEHMREQLVAYMQMYPIADDTEQEVTSPAWAVPDRLSFFQWISPVTLSFVLFFGGTFGYFFTHMDQRSEDPIDPISVTQITTPELVTPNRTELLAERLKEVETFASNPPSVEKLTLLKNDIDQHAPAVRAQIKERDESGNKKTALSIGSDLQNTLERHEKMIIELIENGYEPKAAMTDLLEEIRHESIQTEEVRMTLMHELKNLEDEQAHLLIRELIVELDSELDSFKKSEQNINTEHLNEVHILMALVSEMRDKGEHLSRDHLYAQSLGELFIALHIAKKVQMQLNAGAQNNE